MPIFNPSITTRIRWGHHLWMTTDFHQGTAMYEINHFLSPVLGYDPFQNWFVQFYDANTQTMMTLNQSVLDSPSNPFQWISTNSSEINNASFDNTVELYVIKNTNNNQAETELIALIEQLPSTAGIETVSRIPSPATDDHGFNFSSCPNTNERSLNNFTELSYGSHNPILAGSSLPNHQRQTMNEEHSSIIFADLESLFSRSTSSANLGQNAVLLHPPYENNTSNAPNGGTVSTNRTTVDLPSNTDVPRPVVNQGTRRKCVRRLPLRSRSRSNHPIICRSTGFSFCRDVEKEQKNIYLSDQYNQKDHGKKNGYLSCIQGTKASDGAMKPLIHLDESVQQICKSTVTVYAVQEVQVEGGRQWKIHPRKKFLPEGHTRDTIPQNPISLNWSEQKFIDKHHMELNLRMVTSWDRSVPGNAPNPVIYALSEQELIQLHTAAHDASSPRLMCLVESVGPIPSHWICFSDFIRSK